GRLVDEACAVSQRLTVPGAAVGAVYGEMMAAIMRGDGDPSASRWPMGAGEEALRPGNTVGDVFEAHARILTKAGYARHFLNACGYTMGATYPPTWMDWPMVYAAEPQVLAPYMVFFLHMILLNSDTGLSMSLGETAIVTQFAQRLSSDFKIDSLHSISHTFRR